MRLGTETGSMTNHLMARHVGAPEPAVGMGATILCWTDRHPATIVRVVSAKRIEVQEDKAIRTDTNGMSEVQKYRFEPDPTSPVKVFMLTKRGWVEKGGGDSLRIGERDSYHDYSF